MTSTDAQPVWRSVFTDGWKSHAMDAALPLGTRKTRAGFSRHAIGPKLTKIDDRGGGL
jgi:hypothetical protein